MDTALQNGVMAGAYACLFFLLFQHPIGRSLKLMLTATAFAVLYNVWYDAAIHSQVIVVTALFLRLSPALEASWRVLAGRRDCRASIAFLSIVLLVGCLTPNGKTWAPYLTMRLMLTASVGIVAIMVYAAQVLSPFGASWFLVRHLGLQVLWMGLHVAFSATAPLYTTSWAKRDAARWTYILAAIAIFYGYRSAIRRSDRGPVLGLSAE